MFRRESRLERALRASRPQPSEELERRLVEAISAEPARPISSVSRGTRRPARPRLAASVALLIALVVLAGAFGGFSQAKTMVVSVGGKVVRVVVPDKKKKPSKAQLISKRAKAEGSRFFLASIGTYQAGQWICHFTGTYNLSTYNQSANWTPIQLTSTTIYDAHTAHIDDIGPSASYTTSAACAGAADPPPTVTINQAGGQSDPTNTSPINFTVTFSESVSGFTGSDVSLSGTAGATTAVVSGGPAVYNVAVSGMSGSGTVIASVPAGGASDVIGHLNVASTSADNTVTYDITAPTATISLQAGSDSGTSSSDNLTNATSLVFNVNFSESVSGLASGDFLNAGTAAGCAVGAPASGPTNYTVTVTGCGEGTVVLRLAAAGVTDAAGNSNALTNGPTVTVDRTAPTAPGASYTDVKSNGAGSGPDVVSGSAETGATVSVTLSACTAGPGGSCLGSVPRNYASVTAAGGTYSRTVDNFSKAQSLTFTVTATDAAGNTSATTTLNTSDNN